MIIIRVEICSGLCSIIISDYKYLVPYLNDILNILESLCQKDCFNVNVKIGTLLTFIVQNLTQEHLRLSGIRFVTVIWSLLQTLGQSIPMDLLVLLLSSLKTIAEWALIEGTPIRAQACVSMESIKDFVGTYIEYPNPDVATIAAQLERLLDQNFFVEE